jgi:hypothetical protein
MAESVGSVLGGGFSKPPHKTYWTGNSEMAVNGDYLFTRPVICGMVVAPRGGVPVGLLLWL